MSLNFLNVKKLLYSVLICTQSFNLYAQEDIIECKREKPSTRQFCQIKENRYDLTITLPSEVEFGNTAIDISSSVQRGEITVTDSISGRKERIILSSLRPIIEVSTNWIEDSECRRNSLWSHKIELVVEPSQDSFLPTGITVRPGSFNHFIELGSLYTGSSLPISFSESGGDLNLETSVLFFDQDYSDSVPLPYERIPSRCKLLVYQPTIQFDAKGIASDLIFLKRLIRTTSQLLAKSSVVHANIIDNQRGAICRSFKFSEKLKEAEVLNPNDSLEDLSIESQNYLKSLLIEAKNIGSPQLASIAIDKLLPYLDKNAEQLKSYCSNTEDYAVDKNDFIKDGKILNKQGFENAVLFELELANLDEMLSSTWAIAKASEHGANKDIDLSWINDANLYIYF